MQDSHPQFFSILSGYSSDDQPHHRDDLSTQNHTVLERKYPEFMFSPGMPFSQIKCFELCSPSPFKKPAFGYLDERHFHDERLEIDGTVKKNQFISNIIDFNQTPICPKKHIQMQIESSSPDTEKENKNSLKGLRSLSESVYEIVLELKVTNYKEVTDRLVATLYEKGGKDDSLLKEQQNVKRRVYDSLNVLVSAQILQQEGKDVMVDKKAIPEKMRKHETIGQRQTMKHLSESIEQKQVSLQQKRQKLRELERRHQVMKQIVKRNKKKKFLQQPKVNFPLIGIVSEAHTKKEEFFDEEKNFSMEVKGMQGLVGDIDLLMNIDMTSHNVDEIIEDEIYQDEGFSMLNENQSNIIPSII